MGFFAILLLVKKSDLFNILITWDFVCQPRLSGIRAVIWPPPRFLRACLWHQYGGFS